MPKAPASPSTIASQPPRRSPRAGPTFDAVLLLEVVEHVPDVPAFLKAVAPWSSRAAS